MKRFITYIKDTLSHKVSFWKLRTLKSVLKKHGPTFLIIVIVVEIIEHVGGLLLIRWLGLNVHEYFHALLPAPFLICFHWLTSPIVFFIYIKIVNRKQDGN